MISYSTNCMGPWPRWYEENQIPYTTVTRFNRLLGKNIETKEYCEQWCGGRIDIYGVPGEPYSLEYALSIMDGESWTTLSEYLMTFESDVLLTKKDLLAKFEEDTGHRIRWFSAR